MYFEYEDLWQKFDMQWKTSSQLWILCIPVLQLTNLIYYLLESIWKILRKCCERGGGGALDGRLAARRRARVGRRGAARRREPCGPKFRSLVEFWVRTDFCPTCLIFFDLSNFIYFNLEIRKSKGLILQKMAILKKQIRQTQYSFNSWWDFLSAQSDARSR